jgi:hypothetical protein
LTPPLAGRLLPARNAFCRKEFIDLALAPPVAEAAPAGGKLPRTVLRIDNGTLCNKTEKRIARAGEGEEKLLGSRAPSGAMHHGDLQIA